MGKARIATTGDAHLIAAHCRAMFEAMGGTAPGTLDTHCRSGEAWDARVIAERKYLGWIT